MKKQPDIKKPHGGAREGAGRPAFEPTQADRDKVWQLAGFMSQDDIARLIGDKGIHVDTLREHFAHELAVGRPRADALCCNGLMRKMQAGDLGAICFYAKTRMGWREKSDVNLTGNVKHEHSNLTELRAELDRIASRSGAGTVSS